MRNTRSVLSMIQKCDKCGSAYIEEIGETCRCPSEEPRVEDWEDIQGKSLLSKWQVGEMSL